MNISTLNKIAESVKGRPDELKEEKKNGRKVLGYFCCYIPDEVILAADMIPVRLASFGNNQIAQIGANYLTSNACPYARSCVGIMKEGANEYFKLADIIADAPACMQMRRVLEVLERYFDTKVVFIPIPRQFYSEHGKDYYSKSLEYFSTELKNISNKKSDSGTLKKYVDICNGIRKLQRWLYDGLKDDTFPLLWPQVLEVIRAGFVLDRGVYLELLNELKDEVESTKSDGKPDSKIRILMAGGMLAPGDDKLIKILDQVGGRVVMDELCTGSRGIYLDIDSPDIEAISRRYLDAVPCGSLPYPKLEGDPRHEHIKRILDEYRINGVIYYTLRFCDAYTFKVGHIRKIVNSLGIRFLHINSDHSASDVHQIRTRIEAFVESIRDGI